MNELGLVLQVLIIGMVMVFAILSLVVLTGQILIRLTNRFAPTPLISKENEAEIAAVIATVDVITDGKGQIESIKKIN